MYIYVCIYIYIYIYIYIHTPFLPANRSAEMSFTCDRCFMLYYVPVVHILNILTASWPPSLRTMLPELRQAGTRHGAGGHAAVSTT